MPTKTVAVRTTVVSEQATLRRDESGLCHSDAVTAKMSCDEDNVP